MGTYPTSPRAAFLLWCQEHAPIFTANAVNIGLTPAQATAFAGAVTAAASAQLAQEAAKQAALVATQACTSAFSDLRGFAGDTVRLIRAFAESSIKPDVVYNLAQIPPPAAPSPAPPPGKPTNLSVELDGSSGRLTLRWKSNNPAGTSGTAYIIRRKLPTQSQFAFVGVSGSRRFEDTTFTAGPDSVQYTVQAQRADSTGPLSDIFTVNFGQAPGGGLQAFVSTEEDQTPRLAA